jgi:hypothetical protein
MFHLFLIGMTSSKIPMNPWDMWVGRNYWGASDNGTGGLGWPNKSEGNFYDALSARKIGHNHLSLRGSV